MTRRNPRRVPAVRAGSKLATNVVRERYVGIAAQILYEMENDARKHAHVRHDDPASAAVKLEHVARFARGYLAYRMITEELLNTHGSETVFAKREIEPVRTAGFSSRVPAKYRLTDEHKQHWYAAGAPTPWALQRARYEEVARAVERLMQSLAADLRSDREAAAWWALDAWKPARLQAVRDADRHGAEVAAQLAHGRQVIGVSSGDLQAANQGAWTAAHELDAQLTALGLLKAAKVPQALKRLLSARVPDVRWLRAYVGPIPRTRKTP